MSCEGQFDGRCVVGMKYKFRQTKDTEEIVKQRETEIQRDRETETDIEHN